MSYIVPFHSTKQRHTRFGPPSLARTAETSFGEAGQSAVTTGLAAPVEDPLCCYREPLVVQFW